MDRLIPPPRRWAALAWTVVWALVAGAVYWSAVRTAGGQRLDDHLLARWHSDDLVVRLVAGAVRSAIPLALSVLVARLCLVAWRAGRRQVVAVVGSVLLVAVVLTPLLRDVLLTRPDLGTDGTPDLGVWHNTLPSNHMAFSTALAGAVVVLRRCGARWTGLRLADGDGARWGSAGPDGAGPDGAGIDGAEGDRKIGAVLGALLVVEAMVNVTTHAHRPADTVAGFAVAMMLWSLALGVAPGLDSRTPPCPAEEDPADACAARGEAGDSP